jgi:hypothetical protein
MKTLNDLEINERLTRAFADLTDKYTIPIKSDSNLYEVKPVVFTPDDIKAGLPYGFAVCDMTNRQLVACRQNSGNFEEYLQSSDAHTDVHNFAKTVDINKIEQIRDVLDKFKNGEVPSASEINAPLKNERVIVTTSNKHDWGRDFVEAVEQKLPDGRHGTYYMYAVKESDLEHVVDTLYKSEMPIRAEKWKSSGDDYAIDSLLSTYCDFGMQALDMSLPEHEDVKSVADIKWDCHFFEAGESVRGVKGLAVLNSINKGCEASRCAVEATKMANQVLKSDKSKRRLPEGAEDMLDSLESSMTADGISL